MLGKEIQGILGAKRKEPGKRKRLKIKNVCVWVAGPWGAGLGLSPKKKRILGFPQHLPLSLLLGNCVVNMLPLLGDPAMMYHAALALRPRGTGPSNHESSETEAKETSPPLKWLYSSILSQ